MKPRNYFFCAALAVYFFQGSCEQVTMAMTSAVTEFLFLSSQSSCDFIIQNNTETPLLQSLWAKGFPTTLMEEGYWLLKLRSMTYNDASFTVLVGTVPWILQTIETIWPLFKNNTLNKMKVKFVWVDLEPTASKASNSFDYLLRTLSLRSYFGLSAFYMKESVTPARLPCVLIADMRIVPGKSLDLSITAQWSRDKGIVIPYRDIWNKMLLNLTGTMLRITYLEKPTVFQTDKTKLLKNAVGYCAEVMNVFQEKLGFEVLLVPETSFGNVMDNGSGTGMVGQLMRNVADVASLDFNPTPSRKRAVDFTVNIGNDIALIMTKAPGPMPRPFILFQIFTPKAWLYIFLSTFGLGFLLGLVMSLSTYLRDLDAGQWNFSKNLSEGFTMSYRFLLMQDYNPLPRTFTSRLLIAILLIEAFIIIALYQGIITSFLAIPVNNKPIDTVEELLRTSLNISVRKGTSINDLLASGFILKEVYAKAQVLDASYIQSTEFLDKVAHFKYAAIDAQSAILGYRQSYEVKGTPCALYESRRDILVMPDTFAVQRNSPYKETFNDMITWLRYCGILDHFKYRYYKPSCYVQKTGVAPDDPEKLKMLQMQSSFYVLLVGYVVAFATFLLELFVKYLSQRNI